MSGQGEASPAASGNGSGTFNPTTSYTALFLLLLVYTSNYIDRQILAGLIEPIKDDLGISDTMVGFLTGGVFALFYSVLGIPMAAWADRGNRRNLIVWSLSIWSAMTALCGLAQNTLQLALARIGVGIGEAGSSPPSHSIISDLFPPDKRPFAMAIFSMGVNLGILFGFIFAGMIYEAFDYNWRPAFFVVGLPGLLLAVIVRFALKEPKRGLSEAMQASTADQKPLAEGLKETVHYIVSQRALWQLFVGCTAVVTYGYIFVTWGTSFFIRSHGYSVRRNRRDPAFWGRHLPCLLTNTCRSPFRHFRFCRRGLSGAILRDGAEPGTRSYAFARCRGLPLRDQFYRLFFGANGSRGNQ